MDKQEILKLIAEKIEEHQGPWCDDEFNAGAAELSTICTPKLSIDKKGS